MKEEFYYLQPMREELYYLKPMREELYYLQSMREELYYLQPMREEFYLPLLCAFEHNKRFSTPNAYLGSLQILYDMCFD